jgi:hypothetical protein
MFALLFQSAHSYEHFLVQLSEKNCHHQSKSAFDITHEHNGFEKCFSCEFVFSSFLKQNTLTIEKSVVSNFKKSSHKLFSTTFSSFSGISYALRGPPLT